MATASCPQCDFVCIGEERCFTTCPNCGMTFKMPIGFQVHRRCDVHNVRMYAKFLPNGKIKLDCSQC